LSPGADTLALVTAGTNRLHITSGGLVGLGTSSPGTTLHVVGSSTLAGNIDVGTTASAAIIQFPAVTGWGPRIGQGTSSINALSFYTNNIEHVTIDSSGRLGIGSTTPSSRLVIEGATNTVNSQILITATSVASAYIGTNADGLNLGTDTAGIVFKTGVPGGTSVGAATGEKARIDSSGRLLVGTSSARTGFQVSTGFGNVTPVHQFEFNSQTYNGVSITHNAGANTYPAVLAFGKSRGSSAGIHTAVANGDGLGWLDFYGADGTNMVRAANISAEVDGTPGTNVMPGRLMFSTTSTTASASPTVRMTIKADGSVGINSTSPQTTLDIGGTASIKVPVGTTAQRPASVTTGFVRFNTDLNNYEGYNGSEWGGLGGASEKDTAVATTSVTTCDTFVISTHRSAIIVAQITQGSNYQIGKYLVIHDGTTASVIEENAIATGSMLGTFTVSISGANVLFQVNMTSASSATVTTLMTKVSV
jgi:hypothetical protein